MSRPGLGEEYVVERREHEVDGTAQDCCWVRQEGSGKHPLASACGPSSDSSRGEAA